MMQIEGHKNQMNIVESFVKYFFGIWLYFVNCIKTLAEGLIF